MTHSIIFRFVLLQENVSHKDGWYPESIIYLEQVSKVWNEQFPVEEQPDFCGRAVICVQMRVQVLVTDTVEKMYFLIYYYYSIDYTNNRNAPKIDITC